MASIPRSILYGLFISLFLSCQTDSQKSSWVTQAPAEDLYCAIDTEDKTILPNGRIISPHGKTVRIAPHPYGLAVSANGQMVVTANSGNRPFSISFISELHTDSPKIRQIPEGAKNDEDLLGAVFMGLAFGKGEDVLYVAGGQANKVFIFNPLSGEKLGEIDGSLPFQSRSTAHAYLGDMVLNEAGNMLYVLDQIGFRILAIDTQKKEIVNQFPTGRYPFGITLSPDEAHLYVANVGVFEYEVFPDVDVDNLEQSAHAFPAFGYGSEEMVNGIQNDSMNIPGLGDPNSTEAFSVWEYDLQNGAEVTAKIKTGFLVGEKVEGFPAVGGASPNSLVATEEYVFVSNGNNDCVTVIDPKSDTVIQHIPLTLDERIATYRGMIPFGLALSPDQQTLYVAESGVNAVGIIDIASLKLKGHIPVGWFPSKLGVTPDGTQLIVANAKGYGSGPNGGSTFKVGPEGTYIGHLMKGSISIMNIPTDQELKELTQRVLENNVKFVPLEKVEKQRGKEHPVPPLPNLYRSPIQHIVFISKENRTYDEVFGQVKEGKGEAEMARYGLQQSFANDAKTDSLTDVDVMPNHIALAKRFAISDNFYVDSDHSADGHRWLVNTYPNEWVETHVSAAYGGKRGQRIDSEAPGNFALVGASGAIYPEDYNEAGSIWDHFERNEVSFFNFGFGVEMAGTISDSTMKYAGVKYLVNYPVPGPLFDRSSRIYPTYNMRIPDQFRVDCFIEEVKEKFLGEGQSFPQVLTVILPNDHGAEDRPWAGYPYRESYMADNDLALGRIVEFLSSTPYWENMAIVVTEDDSQDGQDHVDAHRSILMVISPYSKRNYVSHTHYSFGSIFKTFWNILGTPYLNQYDAGATDLADMFQAEIDLSPYQAIPIDSALFDPQKAFDPFDEAFDWKAVADSPELDNVEDFERSHEENDK